MSYTARPPFTGGMSNQNQQQQQSGQPNNANIGASGIPNMPIMNNAASISGNHLPNPSGSSGLSALDQKLFQQQLVLQRQLLLQSTQYPQQQPSQQNQQAKFQQQPNQTQALNRLMSDMLNEKNGSNVAQQSQHLQQFVQLQALSNMMQLQQAAQQKSFQQQSVPLPTNTTITPVARQNMPPMQKQPVNYPRSNVQNKNTPSNVGSSPMQSRKSFPNAPKSTVPQMQSGMVAAPLNISSGSSKSTLPQMPSAMTSATSSPKGYADIFAATLSNTQASMNITPSLTITKTNSPSSSTPSAKSNTNLTNKPLSSMATSQKSFLSEAISMSLGNVPIPVKATQPPSVSVTPANKPTYSPTNKIIPVTPQKINVPPNVPGLQKLSPTSPRTKQTPRKNTNPIRTTSHSLAAVQRTAPTVVPLQAVTKLVTNLPAKPPVVSTLAVATATVASPSSVRITSATPLKVNVAVSTAASDTQAASKPVQAVPNNNFNLTSTAKVSTPIPKVEAAPNASTPKTIKTQETKNTEAKAKEPGRGTANSEKIIGAVKSDNSDGLTASVQPPPTAVKKQTESKSKQNTSQNSSSVANKNQSALLEKKKGELAVSNAFKLSTDQITKTPLAKAPRAANPSVSTPNSVEGKVKRNRFKTIPYQSPTPEIELVSKISANEANNAHKKKVDEDKLTLFYKNEFLAVRNADGGFFLCQAMYNVYKSSPKIRIRWLSEETANNHIYSLDFYDSTDIECVLTSVSLNKVGKGRFELINAESDRIKNILKKALDVEKGIVNRLDVTEENPDGLDLSLYKDESQIEKKPSGKRKAQDKIDSGKTSSAAKKRKISETKKHGSTAAKANKSYFVDGSKSANKSPAKKKVSSSKKAKGVKSSDSEEVKSTPVTKRTATKRKLVSETTDLQTKEADSKRVKVSETSKDGGVDKDVSKLEEKSPKQTSEKPSESVAIPTAATKETAVGRPTRRSK